MPRLGSLRYVVRSCSTCPLNAEGDALDIDRATWTHQYAPKLAAALRLAKQAAKADLFGEVKVSEEQYDETFQWHRTGKHWIVGPTGQTVAFTHEDMTADTLRELLCR